MNDAEYLMKNYGERRVLLHVKSLCYIKGNNNSPGIPLPQPNVKPAVSYGMITYRRRGSFLESPDN